MGSSGFMRSLKSKPFPKQTSSFWSEMIRAWITHLLACDKPLQFLMWSIWLILSVASTSSIQSYISRKPSNFLSIALCVVAQPHGLERIRQQLLNSMLCLRQHAQYTQTIPSQYAVDHEFTACTSGWSGKYISQWTRTKPTAHTQSFHVKLPNIPLLPLSLPSRCLDGVLPQAYNKLNRPARSMQSLKKLLKKLQGMNALRTLSERFQHQTLSVFQTRHNFSRFDVLVAGADFEALKHGAMWNWNWEWNSEWITEWYFINNVSKSKPSKSYFMTCNFSTVCSEAFESLWSCYTVLRNISQPKFPEQSTCPKSQFSQPSDFIPADFGSDEMTLTSLLSPAAFALLCSSLLFSLLHVMLHTYAVCHPNSLNFQNLTWPRTDYLGIIESYQIILNHLHPNATKQGRQNRWNWRGKLSFSMLT